MAEKTLFYLVDWLPPDFGAVGQYGMIFSQEIAQTGISVILIGLTTGESAIDRELCSDAGALEIRRLKANRYNKSGLATRLLWSMCANIKLILEVIRDPRSRGAQMLFTGSPPFMLYFAVLAKWLRGMRLIYRITDFYPEVISAAVGRRTILLACFERVTWAVRKRVDSFEILGEDQRQLLLAGGIAPHRITLKRDVPPISISDRDEPAPCPAELERCKVLLYSGNYGVAHEVDTVVDGLIRHHREGNGQFGLWLNASGSAVGPILRSLRAAGVPCAHREPGKLERLPAVLAAADAHLVTLRPGFSGYVLPSKIYGCIYSGRPILFVGPKSSDIHLLCAQDDGNVYEHVDPGDAVGFASALDRLASPHTNSH
jgi:hypothetical protein